jgi:hypothetical protein
MTPRGVGSGRQQAGVEAVPSLVGDPVLVPDLREILALDLLEPLALEIIDEKSDGPILEIIRGARVRWRGVEGQGVKAVDWDTSLGRWSCESSNTQYTLGITSSIGAFARFVLVG